MTTAGTILPYGGSSAPTGYLLCDGSAVSRTTYSVLFGIIGTAFGPGDGSTTFNIPDLRGRVTAGKDNMGGSAASRLTSTTMSPNGTTLGATGGEETHTLITSEIPAHTHVASAYKQVVGHVGNANDLYNSDGNVDNPSASANPLTGSTGGGGAHNNVQPTLIVNYIIATVDDTSGGTVTSVAISGSNGIGVSGSPITSSGTINLILGAITPTTVNGLTLTSQAVGFTIAGGTSSKTLTVSDNATVSGTNSGDVTLSGENYLSISGQVITVGSVNLSGTNVTGTLAAGRFPALTGDVTTSAGSLSTTISNNAVTNAKMATSAANTLAGYDNSGNFNDVAIGTGLSLSGGTLSATGGGSVLQSQILTIASLRG